jgi:hypothetical protein
MLKSTIEHPAQPNRVIMALGILQGYLNNPFGFLVTTLLTLPQFKKQIPMGFPDEFVHSNALQAWMNIRLMARNACFMISTTF